MTQAVRPASWTCTLLGKEDDMAREYLKTCSFSNNFVRQVVYSGQRYANKERPPEQKQSMTEKLYGVKPSNKYVAW